MNVRYRIYTEDINRQTITDALDTHFSAYTLIPARGVWQGIPEESLVVEILGTAETAAQVRAVAVAIRGYNKQDAVLVTRSPVESELV